MKAYSSSGYKHTEKTKERLRSKAVGRLHSAFTKNLISLILKGEKNAFFNKKHSLTTLEIMSKQRSSGSIYVYDSLLNLQVVFSSLTKLAKSIQANNITLNTFLNNNKLFRGN